MNKQQQIAKINWLLVSLNNSTDTVDQSSIKDEINILLAHLSD